MPLTTHTPNTYVPRNIDLGKLTESKLHLTGAENQARETFQLRDDARILGFGDLTRETSGEATGSFKYVISDLTPEESAAIPLQLIHQGLPKDAEVKRFSIKNGERIMHCYAITEAHRGTAVTHFIQRLPFVPGTFLTAYQALAEKDVYRWPKGYKNYILDVLDYWKQAPGVSLDTIFDFSKSYDDLPYIHIDFLKKEIWSMLPNDDAFQVFGRTQKDMIDDTNITNVEDDPLVAERQRALRPLPVEEFANQSHANQTADDIDSFATKLERFLAE